MKLKDLEEVIRGSHSVVLLWKSQKSGKFIETFCDISTIKYCKKNLLDAKVLRVDIDYQVVKITLRMEEISNDKGPSLCC